MKSRKNGSASIPTKEMRGRRHVTVLKGWKSSKVRRTGGKRVAKTREAEAKRRGALTTPQKWAKFWRKVGSEKAEMATRRCQSARFAFFHSFFLSTFASFSSCSRCQLHDRRLKSHRATPNVITSVLFHLRSICRFEQTHVNTFTRWSASRSTVHQRCLSATVYLPELRFHVEGD